MKTLKIIGIILVAIALVVITIGFTAPDNFDLKREIVIQSPRYVVFNTVSHFSEFPKWNPWQELDPNMKTTLEGTDGTVSAKYSWEGNSKAGAGAMTITKVEVGKTLEQSLEFLKPFKSSATTYFNLEEVDGGTKITWGMKGKNDFLSKIFMTLMGGMDKAVGKDYEKGLAKLKLLCESLPGYQVNEVEWKEKNCLSIRKTLALNDMQNFFSTNLPKMYEAIGKSGAKPGIPLGVFYMYDEKGNKTDVAAVVPFEGRKVTSKEYPLLNLPTAKAYAIDYYGPYGDQMELPYEAMDATLKELGKTNPNMVIEEYVTDPMAEQDSAKWLTKIYFFVN